MNESPLCVHEFLPKIGNDAMILDLGCGPGSINYSQYHCRFTGCDTSRHPEVDKWPPNAEFKLASGDKLPFGDRYFDAVVCNWIFEHLNDPVAVLKEIERVMKPSGYLYLSIPRSNSFEDRLYRALLPEAGGHVQRYEIGTFLRIVYTHSGFKLISFADWAGGFVYLERMKYGAALRRLLYVTFRWIKRLTGRRVPEGSNYIFLFRLDQGTGYRRYTDTCSFCGSGNQLPSDYADDYWQCPGCGAKNLYV
jgi:SAM-dependent methyltransferase